MKQQQTITYIKNGIEKNIPLTIKNPLKNQKEIFKEYKIEQCMSINESIELIEFKNMNFAFEEIKCENNNTMCIFENCTFKTELNLHFKSGSFQLINPKLVGSVSSLNLIGHVENFDLALTEENLSKKMNLALGLTADTITLAGNLSLSYLMLEARKIIFGNDNLNTKLKVLDYGWNKIGIDATELELKKCSFENKSPNKRICLESKILKLDDESIIKTKTPTLINQTYYGKIADDYRIITRKDLARTSLISVLTTYNGLLYGKIENASEKYLQDKLLSEINEIKLKEEKLEELKSYLEKEELELENLKKNLEEQTNQKRNQMIKSLTKKSTTFFNKK